MCLWILSYYYQIIEITIVKEEEGNYRNTLHMSPYHMPYHPIMGVNQWSKTIFEW
jgi:hypothetical protein